jgi:YggT family protein
MRILFGFLAAALGIYSFLIMIRIIISWFGGSVTGKPVEILSRITDPYLNWWLRNLKLRLGFMDFSAIAGIVFLSLVQNIFYHLLFSARITLGNILSIVLLSVWTVVSFILGFCLIVIIIRLIGYITNCNIYSGFWRVIDSISQPLLYRLNLMIFGRRIVGYQKRIITSSVVLAVIWLGGKFIMPYLAGFLSRLPL